MHPLAILMSVRNRWLGPVLQEHRDMDHVGLGSLSQLGVTVLRRELELGEAWSGVLLVRSHL